MFFGYYHVLYSSHCMHSSGIQFGGIRTFWVKKKLKRYQKIRKLKLKISKIHKDSELHQVFINNFGAKHYFGLRALKNICLGVLVHLTQENLAQFSKLSYIKSLCILFSVRMTRYSYYIYVSYKANWHILVQAYW